MIVGDTGLVDKVSSSEAMRLNLEEGSKAVMASYLVLKEKHRENKDKLKVHECVLKPVPRLH